MDYILFLWAPLDRHRAVLPHSSLDLLYCVNKEIIFSHTAPSMQVSTIQPPPYIPKL